MGEGGREERRKEGIEGGTNGWREDTSGTPGYFMGYKGC